MRRAVQRAPKARWLLWLGLGVALGLALAAGAGAFGGGKPQPLTLYQRELQVAGQYRCPVCQGESAAVSDTPASVEIRDQIKTWLQERWSDGRIRAAMVHDYGTSILEKPPASGDGVLVWVIPPVAAAVALAGLGLAFYRWRKLAPDADAHADAGAHAGADPHADAGAHVEGVEPEAQVPGDGAGLEAGPAASAIDVVAAVGAPSSKAEVPRPRSSLAQRVLLVGGVALVVLAGGLWLLDRSTAPRASDQPDTGGVVTSITSELDQAAALAKKDPVAALVIYEEVLRANPDQAVALTAEGWIYSQGGYVKEGLSLLQKAESSDPTYPPPHLYRGLVLLEQDHQPAAAATELSWYLRHHPAAAEVTVAKRALLQARSEAGKN